MRATLLLVVLALSPGCGGSHRYAAGELDRDVDKRVANLKKAAALPWADNGHCVVQEASNEWPVLVERCFDALDSRKIRFQDPKRNCAVASADAAALEGLVGICILSQPEIVVGAVIIIGVVVVAAAIAEELEEKARCKKVAEACRETCSYNLPSRDNGFSFWNCVNACLERHACSPSTK
jgi:hypothetical protein